VNTAEELGLLVQIVLTNNWYPIAGEDPSQGQAGLRKRQADSRPRNVLSNDYGASHSPIVVIPYVDEDRVPSTGGMDAYVREFGVNGHHSEFYTNRTIVDNFKTYVAKIVDRYKDSKGIFAWEIANDARCVSSLPASKDCDTLVVTDWHDEIARHIKSIDKNHLVTSG
jgi:mannan endo-1,4-beta-mannosidase